MNRQQKRAEARNSTKKPLTNSRIDSLPPYRELTPTKVDSLNVKDALESLKPAGPFLNPETQSIQTEPWIPPEPPILPPEHIPPSLTGTSDESGSDLPKALQPLKPKEQKLAEDLSQLYYLLALGISFSSPFGSKAIAVQAPILSESHVRMARHIPKYYAFLEKLVEYNDFMPIVTTHLSVIAAIMTHHDLAPEPAKAHFKMLGSEVTQKVAILDMLEEQARQNGNTAPTAVPHMAA